LIFPCGCFKSRILFVSYFQQNKAASWLADLKFFVFVKRWQKTALLQAWVVGRVVRLANVLFAGCHRISKYFVRGAKKLKHEALGCRVGKSVSRSCPNWSYLYVCPLVKFVVVCLV